MENILIELILTNNCNKRCEYCELNFTSKTISYSSIDKFIDFLSNNPANYTINFFWWEPSLEFDKIVYFINRSKEYVSKYTIWTNWVLLNKDKLDFLYKNKVKIYLSIDNITFWNDINLNLLSEYSNIININFINDPEYIDNSLEVYNILERYWFEKISFMPVFTSKRWTIKNLINLKNLYNRIWKNSQKIKLKSYKYYNWVSSDKQFILDTDMNFYSDLDSLIWLQKQYNCIDIDYFNYINKKTMIASLKDNDINLDKLLNFYNIETILKIIFEIPKKSWSQIDNEIISKIIDNGAQKK